MDPEKKRDREIRQAKELAHSVGDPRNTSQLLPHALAELAVSGQGEIRHSAYYIGEVLRIMADKLEKEEDEEYEQLDAED
jgi:hypothetical protein